MVLLIYGVRLPPLCQKPHINLLGRVTDQVFSESEEWDIDTVSETIASEYERATNLSINKEKQNLPIEEKRTIDVKEIREWLNFIITIISVVLGVTNSSATTINNYNYTQQVNNYYIVGMGYDAKELNTTKYRIVNRESIVRLKHDCHLIVIEKLEEMHRENEKEKKLWSVTTISDMLKNEVYLGKIIWNKKRVARTGSNKLVSNDKEEWIVVENAHEPIISDELFRKANEKAFTNQKKVLAKRGVACPIFFCPTCGRRLGFTSRETGYRCMQAHISGLSGCAESKMDRKEAEETVLDAARNMAQFISENLEKKKREWHKTILKEENIATLKSEKKRLSSRKMKLYSDYRSEVLDKEGYMEELEKTTSRILEITLQIAELENEIAVAKKKCDEATEKEMEVNEIAALQDFDKIQLSKIIEKVFIYEPGRMEISWKMDDIFYKEEKA